MWVLHVSRGYKQTLCVFLTIAPCYVIEVPRATLLRKREGRDFLLNHVACLSIVLQIGRGQNYCDVRNTISEAINIIDRCFSDSPKLYSGP
jgi:hypothetical protein